MQNHAKVKPLKIKIQRHNYKFLKNIHKYITKMAEEGKLDPVIGRHEEIRRVIQILSRTNKTILS